MAKTMSPKAAKALTAEVRRDAETLWQKLLTLFEGEAHKAMGYTSWSDYFEAEFGGGKAQAYRLLRAARVHRLVSLHAETRGMTEAQARVLDGLNEERLAAIAAQVRELGGWSRLSARELKRLAYGPVSDAGARQTTYPLLNRLNDAARAITDLRSNPEEVRDALLAAGPEAQEHARTTITRFRDQLEFVENVIAAASANGSREGTE